MLTADPAVFKRQSSRRFGICLRLVTAALINPITGSAGCCARAASGHGSRAEQRDEIAAFHLAHGASLPVASHRTRWCLGRHVDRQKGDEDEEERIKRDCRDVGSAPLVYRLLVHGGSPSLASRHTVLRTISLPPSRRPSPWGKPEMF